MPAIFRFTKENPSPGGVFKNFGAEEGTRTPTPLRVRGPEPRASANSATTALLSNRPDYKNRSISLNTKYAKLRGTVSIKSRWLTLVAVKYAVPPEPNCWGGVLRDRHAQRTEELEEAKAIHTMTTPNPLNPAGAPELIPDDVALDIRRFAHDLSNALEIIVQTSFLLSTAELKEPASQWLEMLDGGVQKALEINLALRGYIKAHTAK